VTLFDYFVITIIAVSVLLSAMRGFVREVLGLVGWIAAFIAAVTLTGPFSNLMATTILDERLRAVLAFVGVFFGTLVFMSLIALAFSRMLKSAGLGLEDRVLGGLFGLARAFLVIMVLVLLAGLTTLPKQPAWTNAVLSPPLEALAKAMKGWLPQALSRYISYD
jgi:membrane protein required for colicin V production